jgi:hypothetical protein
MPPAGQEPFLEKVPGRRRLINFIAGSREVIKKRDFFSEFLFI